MSDMDPGDCTQYQLALDVPELRVCPCGVSVKNLCRHDAELRWGRVLERRPRDCIARPDPANDPFPSGY